ncbi:MAG TPA: DUF4189 domain-containing protein [Bauldia sp.]|nr:DUF4189 domain-containing protein [Bauldia sp.]
MLRMTFAAAVVATVSVAGLLASTPVFATGAIAVGKPSNVARNGVAVGLNGDWDTKAHARADALTQCKATDVKASTRALCKVVGTFANQCAVIAMDPQGGTSGFGWAVANSSWQAKQQALASCRSSAGARADACKVVTTSCDGNAR